MMVDDNTGLRLEVRMRDESMILLIAALRLFVHQVGQPWDVLMTCGGQVQVKLHVLEEAFDIDRDWSLTLDEKRWVTVTPKLANRVLNKAIDKLEEAEAPFELRACRNSVRLARAMVQAVC